MNLCPTLKLKTGKADYVFCGVAKPFKTITSFALVCLAATVTHDILDRRLPEQRCQPRNSHGRSLAHQDRLELTEQRHPQRRILSVLQDMAANSRQTS